MPVVLYCCIVTGLFRITDSCSFLNIYFQCLVYEGHLLVTIEEGTTEESWPQFVDVCGPGVARFVQQRLRANIPQYGSSKRGQ